MKILCTADLHLGRRPSAKVPADLDLDLDAMGPRAAWQDVVDVALERRVDGVLIAGDLVDEDDDLYEAFGALLSGAARLEEARIPILAVAGNHDGRALPRLVGALDNVTMLGRNGTWERTTLEGADGLRLDVVGWSMPARHHDTSPLATYPWFDKERPTVGLLHADLDVSGGRYAPVSSSELRSTGLDAWLLGHVHSPDDMSGLQPIGYLGPPVGTDPGEPGPRGPWMLELDDAGHMSLTMLPRAPLAWDRITVEVDGLPDVSAVEDAVLHAVSEASATVDVFERPPLALGLELVLTGRTPFANEVRRALTSERLATMRHTARGVTTFVYRVKEDLFPDVDLAWRAQQEDPVGLLARHVLALRARDVDAEALVRRARPHARKAWQVSTFSYLTGDLPSDEELMDRLEQVALRAIDELLRERAAS